MPDLWENFRPPPPTTTHRAAPRRARGISLPASPRVRIARLIPIVSWPCAESALGGDVLVAAAARRPERRGDPLGIGAWPAGQFGLDAVGEAEGGRLVDAGAGAALDEAEPGPGRPVTRRGLPLPRPARPRCHGGCGGGRASRRRGGGGCASRPPRRLSRSRPGPGRGACPAGGAGYRPGHAARRRSPRRPAAHSSAGSCLGRGPGWSSRALLRAGPACHLVGAHALTLVRSGA